MVRFDEIIGELLMHNNCVVIPSLGGFVANTVSAKVDVEKGVMLPPRKALNFNKNLTNNDGLLVSALAEKMQVSYNEADSSVSATVLKIKSNLDQGERVHFQNVGFLYLNKAGKIAFEQDRFFNLLLESYGMGSVQFVPVTDEQVHEEEIEQSSFEVIAGGITSVQEKELSISEKDTLKIEETAPSKKRSSTLKKVVRYAAAAAIIPIAFYSFWIPMRTDVLQSGVIYMEDFNPFNDQVDAKYVEGLEKEPLTAENVSFPNELEEITSNLDAQNGGVFSYAIDEDVYVSVRYNGEKQLESNGAVELEIDSDQGYHLIVGCFGEESNAQRMLTQLNQMGWEGKIVDKHEGLYRVSAASSTDKQNILDKRQQIEGQGLSSWVLNK